MTGAEATLWAQLRANRLDGLRFRRQQVIEGFIVDFYCDILRLIIEVDGPIHDVQFEADREREDALTGRNPRVLRFTNDEVMHDLPGVLAQIRAIAH